eukprot:4057871-Pyramimonas_sp.AAC.1
MVVVNVKLPADSYDINVTPDKRKARPPSSGNPPLASTPFRVNRYRRARRCVGCTRRQGL